MADKTGYPKGEQMNECTKLNGDILTQDDDDPIIEVEIPGNEAEWIAVRIDLSRLTTEEDDTISVPLR